MGRFISSIKEKILKKSNEKQKVLEMEKLQIEKKRLEKKRLEDKILKEELISRLIVIIEQAVLRREKEILKKEKEKQRLKRRNDFIEELKYNYISISKALSGINIAIYEQSDFYRDIKAEVIEDKKYEIFG